MRELEKRGIGRPSTYAHLVESIMAKEYVVKQGPSAKKELELLMYTIKPNQWPPIKSLFKKVLRDDKGKLNPTDLGTRVYSFCIKEFPTLFDYNFTKEMELELDSVESGKQTWQSVCQTTWDSYKDKYTLLKDVKKKEEVKGDYSIVKTKNGPCLVKDKVFLGWPTGVKEADLTPTIIEEYLIDKEKDNIFGTYEGKTILKKKGPYGLYVQIDGKNISLQEDDTLETLVARLKKKEESLLHVLEEFQFRKGPYGNYMMKKPVGGKKPIFVNLPSDLDVKKLTYEAAKRIYDTNSKKKKNIV